MAGLPRTTAYRRIRRAAENDLKLILSVGSEDAMSSAQSPGGSSVGGPVGGSLESVAEASHASYQRNVPLVWLLAY